MTTKEKILHYLEAHAGEYCSGAELGAQLGLTRSAVWKGIEQLRQSDYEITAVSNRGYSLACNSDVLSASGINRFLSKECAALSIEVYDEVESTNLLLRERAERNAPHGLTLVANSQTHGRGRWGRSFFAPSGVGAYFSLLLRPEKLSICHGSKITALAAVAAAEAIERVSHVQAQIKWVNDVYVNSHKVCGILTEASVGLENGEHRYIVLGVGINLYKPPGDYPEELRARAGCILPQKILNGRNRLIAEFLNIFYGDYCHHASADCLERYRSRCFTLGREVTVVTPTQERSARALAIDQDYRLVVEYKDHTVESLSAGEANIKGLG
ncbi:MAG: biotin--[acetyl-CoA-carboxylase] ligase [Planctomycetia bacterium]|nr:biotin--[acetyl-CoA-carboxylase] ligase [Planctomycetia bacterium]